MKRTVSLFEFMPYGAPDLLAAGRDHTVRAVLLASSLAVAAWLAAIPLAMLLRSTVGAPPPIEIERFLDPVPPSVWTPPAPLPAPRSAAPARATQGVPLPVPEADAPPEPAVSPSSSTGEGSIEGGELPGEPAATGFVPSPPTEALPALGDYVAVDELPEPVVQFKPPYPDFARDAGVEGLVIVHALIGKDGRVIRVTLDPTRSIPLLNEAALEAAKRWVFKPAYANRHPVPVWYGIPFHFVLHE